MKNNEKYLKIMITPVYIFIVYIMVDIIFIRKFDDIDVTGLGVNFLYVLIGIFAILGIVCFKNAFLVPEKGVNYKFNKIISIIFIVFSIICFLMGIYLRAEEEKMAKKYNESFDFLLSDNFEENFLDNLESIEKFIEPKTKQEIRLETIQSEINEKPNTLYRYFIVFTTGMSLNGGGDRYSFGDELYYITYTIISVLSIYLGVFFMLNSNQIKIFEYDKK